MTASKQVRFAGWSIIVLLWLAGLATCELLARSFGGFVIVGGRPATAEPHVESGEVAVETLGGVAIWRRQHPDRPVPRPKKEGFRIVVIGDSVLVPALLEDRDGAARVLENELNARLDRGPYEVVNLSEGGWNTVQEEQILIHEIPHLDPDLVLVGVSANDLQEFAYRDGRLLDVSFLRELDRRSMDGLLDFIPTRSYLYNLIWLRWSRFVSPLLEGAAERKETDAIVEPIRRMAARSSGYGARFGVLCFPFLQRERFDPATDRCPFRHLLSLAADGHVPLLDPIPVYAHYPNREIRLDDIHLSRFGHRVLAVAMLEWLVALRLVPYDHVRPLEAD